MSFVRNVLATFQTIIPLWLPFKINGSVKSSYFVITACVLHAFSVCKTQMPEMLSVVFFLPLLMTRYKTLLPSKQIAKIHITRALS